MSELKELIAKAKQKDLKAMGELFNQFKPLLKSRAKDRDPFWLKTKPRKERPLNTNQLKQILEKMGLEEGDKILTEREKQNTITTLNQQNREYYSLRSFF